MSVADLKERHRNLGYSLSEVNRRFRSLLLECQPNPSTLTKVQRQTKSLALHENIAILNVAGYSANSIVGRTYCLEGAICEENLRQHDCPLECRGVHFGQDR
jgi:hypothetical protein